MDYFEAGLTGFLAGLCVACGGSIKDAPYEGFKSFTFLRSPVIGLFAGLILYHLFRIKNFVVLFLAVIGLERVIVELFKLYRAVTKGYKPGKFIFGEWGISKKKNTTASSKTL